MSGLLLGILLARTVGGLVAELGGWRLIYGLAAGAMLVLARRAAPGAAGRRRRRRADSRYGGLLRSVGDAGPRGAGAAAADGARLPRRW